MRNSIFRKIFLLCLVVVSFASCKKNETKEDLYPAVALSPEEQQIALGEELFKGVGNCFSCHLPEKKVIGPSIKEIAQIYQDQNADMVTFLKGKGEPIVDPSQYEVMRANFLITKNMTDEQLQAIDAYMKSFLK